jgi:hypothetical protein
MPAMPAAPPSAIPTAAPVVVYDELGAVYERKVGGDPAQSVARRRAAANYYELLIFNARATQRRVR